VRQGNATFEGSLTEAELKLFTGYRNFFGLGTIDKRKGFRTEEDFQAYVSLQNEFFDRQEIVDSLDEKIMTELLTQGLRMYKSFSDASYFDKYYMLSRVLYRGGNPPWSWDDVAGELRRSHY
jgi:hypothetical protein